MKLVVYFPNGTKPKHVELDQQKIRIGRDSRCELKIDGTSFPKVSGLHAELVVKDGRVWLVHRSTSNSTVVDGQAIVKPIALKQGQRFRLGFTGPEIEFVSDPSEAEQTVFSGKASDYLPTELITGKTFQLDVGGILGRDSSATFQLEHPHVSRRHAVIQCREGVSLIADLGSANGTYVDGTRITGKQELTAGSTVDIGPFSLVFDGHCLISRSRLNNIRLDVNELSYVIDQASSKKKLYLLNGVSFCVEPGAFVAVLGPSGSGKSTLLRIISGREWPFSGSAEINGRDLHSEFSALKEDIVVVPQSTMFHDVLSVRQVINYAVSLRLPIDTNQVEKKNVVDLCLSRVGLADRAESMVRNLSGGQLKRLALANELVSDPSLLFLDEVTSGLDEKADGEMMQLMRSLAETGKTVVCVTHNLAHIESYSHKVLILTVGGRVAFFGSPSEAKQYFGVAAMADIYDMLATKQPEQWAVQFLNSEFGRNDQSKLRKRSTVSERQPTGLSTLHRLGLRPMSQTWVLARRYVDVWRNDWMALLALLGQAALVTVLLCLVFSSISDSDQPDQILTRKTEIRNVLFLIGISCFWLGANNAAKELVKERTIYERERNFNLSPESYWVSKTGILSLIGFIQSMLLTVGVVTICGVPGDLLPFVGCSLLLSFIGTNLGLAISAISRTEELAVALVPIVVIPQIILAGVVASLNDISSWLAKIITSSYWGQKIYEQILPEADRFVSDSDSNIWIATGVLFGQLIVFAGAALLGVRFHQSRE